MTSSQSQFPVVTNPSVEFLLKQVYAVHTQQITSLTQQLGEAKAKLAKKSICTFCTFLTKEVQELRNQLQQLLQGQQERDTADVAVQASLPEILVPLPLNYETVVSPARKRLCAQVTSPAKSDSSKLGEDVLVPNTPERNPQRESRVKRWFQTMEVLETIEPNVIEDLFLKPAGHAPTSHNHEEHGLLNRLEPVAESLDLDETMLPDSYIRNKLREPLCVPTSNREKPKEHSDNSNASSEDLLDGAVERVSEHIKENWRAEIASQTLLNTKSSKPGQPRPFKYKDDPVRKREDRMKLPAQQCADCAKYYADEDGAKRRDICSRHRATYAAPATPEHFWELDFPDTQMCKERGYHNITQKAKLRSRRTRPFKSLDEHKG